LDAPLQAANRNLNFLIIQRRKSCQYRLGPVSQAAIEFENQPKKGYLTTKAGDKQTQNQRVKRDERLESFKRFNRGKQSLQGVMRVEAYLRVLPDMA
jgi:hypothetical protein